MDVDRVYVETDDRIIEAEQGGHAYYSNHATGKNADLNWENIPPEERKKLCRISESLNKLSREFEALMERCQHNIYTSS